MVASRLWATYEASPAGEDNANQGDDEIRATKVDIRERMAVDHEWNVDQTVDGRHLHATLKDHTTNPANIAGYGILFTKTVDGVVELCYIDSAGTVKQLTSNGILLDTVLAKTGDWMLSTVTTARTGWTNVSATYANKFMRISATPLTLGGADTHDHGAATGSHTLTIAEMPAHTHDFDLNHSYAWNQNRPATSSLEGAVAFTHTTTSTGGGGGHTHTVATADNVPAYVQVVVFQKD